MTRFTFSNLHQLSTEAQTLSNAPQLRKVNRGRAFAQSTTDDFVNPSTGTLVEEKRAFGGTVNQVHVLKADIIIIATAEDQYLVLTMGELFPFLRRQHSFTKWDCASCSTSQLLASFDTVTGSELSEAISACEDRLVREIGFNTRKQIAKNIIRILGDVLENV